MYIGMSSEVQKRLERHNRGQNKTTKLYVPFDLVYTEEFNTRPEAREREKYLKSGIGREYLKRLLSKSN